MPAIAKIGPRLGFCGVLSGLLLIGWAARHSVAQGPPQDSPPKLRNEAVPDSEPIEAKVPVPQDPTNSKSEPAPALREPGSTAELPVPRFEHQRRAPLLQDQCRSRRRRPAFPSADVDDPERGVIVFVEENQKHAESQLKALKEEAEKLRARLTKVEAGIKRWDRVLEALKQSQSTVATVSPDDRAPASPKANVPTEQPVLKDPGPPGGQASTLTPVDAPSSPRTSPEPAKPAGSPADLVPRSN